MALKYEVPLKVVPIPLKPRQKRRKPEKWTRSRLIHKLDRLASLFVRREAANDEGLVKCYTCPYVAHWKKMQNGHYITRSRYFTRWALINMRPQCFVCNMRNQGMSHLFRERLVQEEGEEAVHFAEEQSKRDNKEFKDADIQNLIDQFQVHTDAYENA